jgi:hypothetical protein
MRIGLGRVRLVGLRRTATEQEGGSKGARGERAPALECLHDLSPEVLV